MAGGQMFKSSMSGFNKKEVLDYIEALNKQKDSQISLLKSEIEELESIINSQKEMITSKDGQISELLCDVEAAQQTAAEKYLEIAQLMDKMAQGEQQLEQQLKETIERKEDEFTEQLDKKDVEIFEVRQQLKQAIESKESLIAIKDRDIAAVRDEMDKRIDEIKGEYEGIISAVRQESGVKIRDMREKHRQEIYDVKCKNERALVSAKAELEEIRASLESARIVEDNARVRAEKMILGAQQQCDEMKIHLKRDMELKRAEALKMIDAEVEFRRAEALEASRRMQNIVSAIRESKEQFARECDEIVHTLEKSSRK